MGVQKISSHLSVFYIETEQGTHIKIPRDVTCAHPFFVNLLSFRAGNFGPSTYDLPSTIFLNLHLLKLHRQDEWPAHLKRRAAHSNRHKATRPMLFDHKPDFLEYSFLIRTNG